MARGTSAGLAEASAARSTAAAVWGGWAAKSLYAAMGSSGWRAALMDTIALPLEGSQRLRTVRRRLCGDRPSRCAALLNGRSGPGEPPGGASAPGKDSARRVGGPKRVADDGPAHRLAQLSSHDGRLRGLRRLRGGHGHGTRQVECIGMAVLTVLGFTLSDSLSRPGVSLT